MRRALTAAMLLLCAVPARAQRSLTIDHFDAFLTVSPNGRLDVRETIDATFQGSWNGLYRTIPLDYNGTGGLNYKLMVTFDDATSPGGAPLKHQVERSGNNLKIKVWVPGAYDASRTVVLRYHVTNAIRFFSDHDELYWNVTGNEWDYPITSATAHVILPRNASGLQTTAFTGWYGSTAHNAAIQQNGNTIDFATAQSLGLHEGLTVVVGWNKGVVTPPSLWTKLLFILESNLIFLLPLLALLFMWRRWYLHGRDPRRLPISPQYDPPRDMTPAEVGTLADNSVDIRDVTATIVDLAVRGFIKIEEREESHLLFKSKSYVFQRVKPASEWAGLPEHEQKLLQALFGGRDEVSDNDLHNEFYKDLPDIREAVFDALVFKQYYAQRPNKVIQTYSAIGIASIVLVATAGTWLATHFGFGSPVAAIIAAVATGAVVIGFGRIMPARTINGARTFEKVLGFEEFLQRVEKDRFERVIKTPELFEKYLPFAMALNLDRQWCNAFATICTQPPQWYGTTNPGAFNMILFHDSLNHMASTTATQMQSAPRSSSGSSGFGGGGFSGGGFGGGGGGGF